MIHEEQSDLWLVHCAGRPTQTSTHGSPAAAHASAQRLARQWPGHTFTVFEGTAAYTADRGPRPEAIGHPEAPPGTLHY